jgi:SAM-dependent methyltransferase
LPVSHDDVLWTYRILLGREPENDEIVRMHMALPTRESLRSAFMSSAEFRDAVGVVPVGRFQEAENIPVEVDCTPEQREYMVRHIASEWRRYGAEAPHWSVLTGEQFAPDRIDENIELFYETGRGHAATMLNPLSRSGIDTSHFGRVMDFGCGVGRLTLALAPIADRISGVDISPPHLALARERAGDDTNASFVAINTVDEIRTLGPFDLVVSFIALQHNPPPVIAEILRNLLTTIAPGGCIVVQIPTYIDGYTFQTEKYVENPVAGIGANSIPQHTIYEIFAKGGCDMLEVREENFLGAAGLSHTFAARKR